MADQTIDNLTLNIKVKDNGSAEKLDTFAKSVANLSKAINEIDTAKLDKIFTILSMKAKKVSKTISDALTKDTNIQTTEVASDTAGDKVIKAQQGEAQKLGDIIQETNISEEQITKLKKSQSSFANKISKDEDKTNKKQKSTLVDSIKRVAIYRIIRAIIKDIAKSFKESIDDISKVSKSFNTSMSNITSSIDKMKMSIGVAFYQYIILFEPVIIRLTNAVTQLGNAISYITAKLRGQNTFLKINADYWKDYQTRMNGALLAFDTFTTLGSNQEIDYTQMFEEVEVSASSLSEELKGVENTLAIISLIIGGIASLKIITWISGGGIATLGASITKFLANPIAVMVAGITLLAIGIADIVTSWNNIDFSVGEKFVTILSAVLAGVIGIVIAFKALSLSLPVAIGIGTALAGAVLLIGTEISKAAAFADGGMLDGAGTMYAVAGESGAEIVAQGSAGTGVLNIEQFKTAMVQAFAEYGVARESEGSAGVYLDGNKVGSYVAGSAGFRTEANRRNTSLNWK